MCTALSDISWAYMQSYVQLSKPLEICGSLSRPTVTVSVSDVPLTCIAGLPVSCLFHTRYQYRLFAMLDLPGFLATKIMIILDNTPGHGFSGFLIQIKPPTSGSKAAGFHSLPHPGRLSCCGSWWGLW